LPEARAWIDAAYGADRVEEICDRLESRPEPAAKEALTMIRANSPTALKLALRALRQGRELPDLAACLAMEHNIVSHLTQRGDFREGIRAAVIDKDRKPKWSPARLEEVSEAAVEDYFRAWA
jgi:enoyl-CoA hydratase